MNMSIKRAAATAAGLSAAMSLVGCGAILEQATEEVVEQAVESETGGDVEIDFDSDDGTISVTGEDGEEFSIDIDEDGESVMSGTDAEGNEFEMSSGQGVPDDWPSELALPGGEPFASSVFSEGGQQILSVTYEMTDGAEVADRLVAEYENRGFTNDSTSTFESDGAVQSFTTLSNADWTVQITGISDGDTGNLSISAQTKVE